MFEKVSAMRIARSNTISGTDGSSRKSTRYSMKKASVDITNSNEQRLQDD